MPPRRSVIALCVILLCLSHVAVRGEGYVAIYAGPNRTQNHDLVATESFRNGGFQKIKTRIDFHASQTVGVRVGGWLDGALWLGGAVDFSGYRAEGDVLRDADIFSTSFLFMLRAPLWRSESAPNGRIRPYLGVGPSIFLSDFMVDLKPTFSRRFGESPLDIALGIDARAGIDVLITERVSLFAEFRYTHFNAGFDDQEGGDLLSDPRAERGGHQTFNTRHFLIGLAFNF